MGKPVQSIASDLPPCIKRTYELTDEEVPLSIPAVGGLKGRQGAVLGDGGGADGKGIVNLEYLIDNAGARDHIAHPPPGHAIHLGKAMTGNQAVFQFRDGGQAEIGQIIIDQEVIGLINKDEQIPILDKQSLN